MYYKIDGKEYTSINAFARKFGIAFHTLKQKLESNSVEILEKNNRKYIDKKYLEAAIKESERIIGFREIVEGLVKKLNSKMDSKSPRHLNMLITFVSGNNYFGVECILSPVYKLHDSLNFYIYKKDRGIMEDGIMEYLLLCNKPYNVKINILCRDSAFDDKKITVKFIKEYLNYVNKDKMPTYVEAVNFLRLTADKELTLYTDEEISAYMKFSLKELTKAGCTNLIGLYGYMQKNVECKSTLVLGYDSRPDEKENITPYDVAQYMKLAYMIFNEEYWKTHNMIHKAIVRERYAKIWLYHAMHYICDWRRADIIGNLPRITLGSSPEKILQEIESGIITESQYKNVCNEIATIVNYKPEKPNKIKRFKRAPLLRLYIPESFSSVIGMLTMVCEAHNQIKGKKEALCHMSKSFVTLDGCNQFFGDEYNDLFDGHKMSNRRANKSHMTMLSETGEKLGTDGYLIASYARSHTGGINKLSEVTSKYLQAKMDGYSIDEITKNLFERGVCSFVPFLFCDFLRKEEFSKIGIKDQTFIMNSLPIKAFDIENLLKTDDAISVSIKRKVAEVIKWANKDNVSELIKEALESIVNGECIGKNEGVYCLRKACGKECSEKYRTTCIGCGYEMYVKAFILGLRNEIKFQEHSLDVAKTAGERIKRTAILAEKLYPTVVELLSTVKYIYGQEIDGFKQLYLGDDKNDDARIG